VAQVAQFAVYFGRSPEDLTADHVRQYQLHLLQQRKVSWSTFNQCVCALRFLYGTTLGRKEYLERLPYGRRPKHLPRVLSQAEVHKLLRCAANYEHRVLLMTLYATGLRVGELVRLGVADIDSQRMVILVERGKGNKQRLVPLSSTLLVELRRWWQTHRDPVWLFPGREQGRPLQVSTVQRACQKAVERAELKAGISPHTLRHTFATELLEAGIDLPSIQKILGHSSLSTTAVYLHVRRTHLEAASQAVDLLPLNPFHESAASPKAPAPRSPK
jgi:site-specific recombinase XerD